jgi:hypothetical protein
MARRVKNGKISSEFAARLNPRDSKHLVRAIVILKTNGDTQSPVRPRTRASRSQAISRTRQAVLAALDEIDHILSRHNGRRLRTIPDALGSIPVETTSAGIRALANSRHVKAILEDQAVSLLS